MELPLFYFVPVVSCPVSGNHCEESGLHLLCYPHQVFIHMDRISLNPISVSLLCMSAALSPSSSPWPFAGLTPLCPCLSCAGEPRVGPITPDVSHQCWQRGRPTVCWSCFFWCSPRCRLPSFLQGYSVGWCLMLCPPGLPVSFLECYFQAGQPPAYAGSWACSWPETGLSASLYWTSWDSSLPTSKGNVQPSPSFQMVKMTRKKIPRHLQLFLYLPKRIKKGKRKDNPSL